jgi:peptidoglycan/xylan/chitin deacetylase (PgdA/CDA1 family)
MTEYKHIKIILLCLLVLIFFTTQAFAYDNSANVLMYSRFDEPQFNSLNTSIDDFKSHIEKLKSTNVKVVHIDNFIEKIAQKQVSQKNIAITIEGAYASFYEKAYPILKKNNIPFMLFVPPSSIGRKGFMTWDNIIEIKKNHNVSFGIQSMGRKKIPTQTWQTNLKDIKNAYFLFYKKTGITPRFFSYPYGYADENTFKILKKEKFIAAFGQHSGSVHNDSNMFYLPRFVWVICRSLNMRLQHRLEFLLLTQECLYMILESLALRAFILKQVSQLKLFQRQERLLMLSVRWRWTRPMMELKRNIERL